MTKEYNIIGKNLDDEEEEGVSDFLIGREIESLKPLADELVKTPEELRMIEKINEYLKEEFAELDISEKPLILPEQIHLLPHQVYEEKFSEHPYGAVTSSINQVAYFDKSKFSRINLYRTILHEAIHLVSFHKYWAFVDMKSVSSYHSGYDIQKPNEKSHGHFRGLTEAVDDKMVLDILERHRSELMTELNIDEQEARDSLRYYDHFYGKEIDVLNLIVERISTKTKEDKKIIWRRFKRGLITGEMMFLREIEKIFGHGSLRVLAAMGSAEKIDSKENHKKYMEFFSDIDDKRREELAKEILIERERLKYQERRKSKK